MDITEKKVFRKSLLGGFSKEDVNNYIAESTEKYAAQVKEAEEKYLAADKEREDLAKKLREAEEKIEELTKKSEELDALRTKHNALSQEHGDALIKLTEFENELAQKMSAEAELSAKVTALSAVEAEYTARKTELADIEISARARAGEIINEAEAEASRKRAELDNELSLRRRDFEEKKAAAFLETGDAVAGISRLIDSLKNEVDSMDSRITRIADTVKNNVASLCDAVVDAQDKVASIKDRLSSDDEQKGNI